MRGGRRRRRRLVLFVLPVLCAALLWPASSHAFIACNHSGTQLTVNLTADGDSVTFVRFGDQIAVLTGNSLDQYGGYDDYGSETQILIPCTGGTPTATNTDYVNVIQSAGADEGSVTIDESAGPLGPGATSEADGTSEIEFGLNLPGRESEVFVRGSDAPETVQIGTLPSGSAGINLNAGAEQPSSADADVEAAGASAFLVDAEGGNDVVTAQGGPGFVGPLRSAFASAEGGAGNDYLQAGPLGSELVGDQGSDKIIGSPRVDALAGGRGADQIFAGHGNDHIFSLDRRRDLVVCGAGKRDYVLGDVADREVRCERGRQLRLRKHGPVPDINPFEARFR